MPDLEDPWLKHKIEIRDLYMTNSIEEVKRVMEEERGFPRKYSTKTWIEKIGDLKVRKNATKKEWHVVWQHVQSYLEDPTRLKGDLKLKRTKFEIAISVHGRRYTWDQAWKNMKSAGAVGQPIQGSPSPLPSHITIRPTPSLSPDTSVTLRPGANISKPQAQLITWESRSAGLIRQQQVTADQRPMTLVQPSLVSTTNDPSIMRHRDRVLTLALGTIPSFDLFNKVLELTKISYKQMIALLGPGSDLSIPCLSRQSLHTLDAFDSDISSMIQSFGVFLSALLKRPMDIALATPVNHVQAYVCLSMAIYLFSNNLVDIRFLYLYGYHEELFAKLDVVFALVSEEHLQALLQSRLSSIRASWEKFLLVAGVCKQARFFRTMIDVGIANCWFAVPKMGHTYLWLAASLSLTGVVRRLLSIGCRPDQSAVQISYREGDSAIACALRNGDLESARLLLQHCNVNRPIKRSERYWDPDITTFQILSQPHESLVKDRSKLFRMLVVEAGANLDEAFRWGYLERHTGLGNIFTESRREWWPSILDYLFYFERPVFDQVAHYSQALASKVTRSGVLLALEKGDFENYQTRYLPKALGSNQVDPDDTRGFLQLILVEQFMIADFNDTHRRTDLDVVRALLDLGIDFPSAALPYGYGHDKYGHDKYGYDRYGHDPLARCNQASFALSVLVKQINHQLPEVWRHEIPALQLLIDHGAMVGSHSLRHAVKSPGTDLLKFLTSYVDDVGKHGRYAFLEAARLNKIESMQILLDAGVDINSEKGEGSQRASILACFTSNAMLYSHGTNMIETIGFMVGRGAILRLSKKRPRPSDLLRYLLDSPSNILTSWVSSRSLIELIFDQRDPLLLSSSMLEYCAIRWDHSSAAGRRAIFEYLYGKGAHVQGGGALAAYILLDGEIELVRQMLEAGTDMEHYLPQGPYSCSTALQTAARLHKEEAVSLLLEAGATVNAPAIGLRGCTALQATCEIESETQEEQQKKKRIMTRLICSGANINAAPARIGRFTALQVTAKQGDLDAAVLLLQKGADVNAPPCKWLAESDLPDENALDNAAKEGRLDMVKLLLNANALSGSWGETGYDGAVELAEDDSHFAVADMIRQHAAENRRDKGLRNPYLSDPPRDWHEYEDEWDRADVYYRDMENRDPPGKESWSDSGSSDVSGSEDEESFNAPDRCETVVSAEHHCHDRQPDVSAEAPDNVWAAVDQDIGLFGEEGDFNQMASETVWAGLTSSITQGNEHMGGHVIEELDIAHSDPVLSDLTFDDSLMVWEPAR